METCDKHIFDRIVQGDSSNTAVIERVVSMLGCGTIAFLYDVVYGSCREYKDRGFYHQKDCLVYFGRQFRILFNLPASFAQWAFTRSYVQRTRSTSDEDAGRIFVERLFFIHQSDWQVTSSFNLCLLAALTIELTGKVQHAHLHDAKAVCAGQFIARCPVMYEYPCCR